MARVLVVEDEHTDRIILLDIVERGGHDVFFAFGGEEALDIHLKGGVDIIITDLSMPEGDGLELIEALRGLRPETPIIVVSGMQSDQLAKAESMGAFVALTKPVDPQELRKALLRAVERKREG